jgi:glycosyltransferase involved in cell wall biosynthesis
MLRGFCGKAPTPMTKTKALCIFTTLLGNEVTTQRLIEALNGIDTINTTYVLLATDDYRRYPVPRWARASDAWESRYLARSKVDALLDCSSDILLVNCWEFVTEFRHLARRIPAAAFMDAVPATVDDQLRRRGSGGWRRTLANAVHDFPFSRAVRNFSYYLPMGSDCADALEVRYQIPRDRCMVTLAPQDLKFWTPAPKSPSDLLRLLFVGNDFARKGGDFLLHLYARYLAGSCNLTIVSNDPALDRTVMPAGAIWRRGLNRDEILQAYRDSDLFLLPTLQDYMPQVLAEALSAGLPCIANNVGGIRDLIRDGETGFLMAYDAPASVWAERISFLHSSPRDLDRLAKGARSFAERNLDTGRFGELVAGVIELLRTASRAPRR